MTHDGPATSDLGGLDPQQRLALEKLVADAPRQNRPEPPTSEIERILCVIWARNLGVEEVGVTDDFFDLGGDSNLAMAIAADAAEEGIVLPAESMFERPTVVALAPVAIRADPMPEQSTGDTEPEVRTGGGDPDFYPVTSLQSRMAAAAAIAPDSYVTRVGCVMAGPIDPHRLADAWGRVGAAVESLRARFVRVGGEWKQYFPDVPLDVRVLAQEPSLSASDWMDGWRRRRDIFDRLDAPLLRVQIAPLEPGVVALAMTHHHLLLDGWSQQLLVGLLESAYIDEDWSRDPAQNHYRQWLSEGAGSAGTDPSENRPMEKMVDRRRLVPPEPRPALATSEVNIELEEASVEAIERWSRPMGLTVASTVQTAWATVLWSCAGSGPVLEYGLITNGRSGTNDLSSIGMFADVSIVPFAAPEMEARFGDVAKQLQLEAARRLGRQWPTRFAAPTHEPESAVVVQNIPIRYGTGSTFAGARIERLEQSITETVPLVFEWRPRPSPGFTVRYDARLVTRTLLTTITRSLESILGTLDNQTTIEDISATVAAIATESASERHERQAADVLAWRPSSERSNFDS